MMAIVIAIGLFVLIGVTVLLLNRRNRKEKEVLTRMETHLERSSTIHSNHRLPSKVTKVVC